MAAKLTKSKLPYPRLELRWRKATKDEAGGADFAAEWGPLFACDYVLVLHKKHDGDMRCNHPKTDAYGARDVEFVLNTTLSGGGGPRSRNGKVDTPFRDGAHAQWDAEVLDLPVYAIDGRNISQVEIRK